ncbi:MAG: SH3 domain-containing protein [Phormidesmis sp. CAN_BIN36]|nr:SH3 domain-containing protein [Phormidesmis sp. CAN_BIN36]
MENLAYLHLAVDFEDSNPEPKLRSLKELGLSVPNSAWIGVASLAIAVSILASAHSAMALVQRGSTGSPVTAVQSALRNRGYDVAVDGVYGSRTANAVSLLQGYERISADGVVGPQTAAVLGLSGPAYGNGGGTGGGNPGNGSSTGVVTVTGSTGVNIRSGPGTGYGVVGGLGYGTRVSTYGSSSGWYRVNGGWISASYTSAGGGGGTGGGNSGSGYGTVTAGSGLLIRSGPGTDFGVVSSVRNGASIPIYNSSNGWYRTDGGWVSASYIR